MAFAGAFAAAALAFGGAFAAAALAFTGALTVAALVFAGALAAAFAGALAEAFLAAGLIFLSAVFLVGITESLAQENRRGAYNSAPHFGEGKLTDLRG